MLAAIIAGVMNSDRSSGPIITADDNTSTRKSTESPKSKPSQPKTPSGTDHPKDHPDSRPSESGFSLKNHFDSRKKLKDRFLELQEFDRSVIGRKIQWTGFVDSVNDLGKDEVSLCFTIAPGDFLSGFAFANYPADFRTKLYSLRKNDQIIVHGIIERAGYTPSIGGSSVTFFGDIEKPNSEDSQE